MRIFEPMKSVIVVVALLIGGVTAWAVNTDDIHSGGDFAILIVGDESDAEMIRKEKVLIQEMAKSLKKQNKVAIYSYHFNKERERTYCEKKLNILREDLLFIGLVSLKERVPRKVIYRLDRIMSPSRAASDILGRSEEILSSLAPGPAETPSASPTPGPTVRTNEGGKWRVQLGVFTQQKLAQDLVDQLKHKGYEAKMDKATSDDSSVFKVWIGSFATKEDAQQTVTELQADGFEKGFAVEGK